MNFDVPSVFMGVLFALVIMFIWRRFKTTSYYDVPTFTDDMTLEQGNALQEKTAKMLAEDLTKRQAFAGTDEAAVGAATREVQDAMVKLAADFGAFTMRKSMTASPVPAPAPEAPAPAPEAPAPQTSTYEIEPYHG
jgi:hypothetical protein